MQTYMRRDVRVIFDFRRKNCLSAMPCCSVTSGMTSGAVCKQKRYTTTFDKRSAAASKSLRPDPVETERFFLQRLAGSQREASPFSSTPTSSQTAIKTDLSMFPPRNIPSSRRDDVRFHRRLSSRFTSQCDQEKSYGNAEMAFHTIHNDVQMRLCWAREALRIIQETLLQPSHVSRAVPRRLVVLVLYSHTRHNAAVGLHMGCICDHVKAMLAERHEEVLGVLTAAVGVKWRSLATPGTSAMSHINNNNNNNSSDLAFHDDVLWYPNGGLYTFNALLQCLSGVGIEADAEDKERESLQLHRKVLIISEGWFHVRTAAELHQPPQTLSGKCADTVDVEPLPFVLGSAHSKEELRQFARYAACRAVAL
ncbi:hypothetical protein TCSYLVIO_002306 [Trypanosoma cruzi]|nr:hypothetical protein TCSYLVIO_002306 [Trypanosoma cruzi]